MRRLLRSVWALLLLASFANVQSQPASSDPALQDKAALMRYALQLQFTTAESQRVERAAWLAANHGWRWREAWLQSGRYSAGSLLSAALPDAIDDYLMLHGDPPDRLGEFTRQYPPRRQMANWLRAAETHLPLLAQTTDLLGAQMLLDGPEAWVVLLSRTALTPTQPGPYRLDQAPPWPLSPDAPLSTWVDAFAAEFEAAQTLDFAAVEAALLARYQRAPSVGPPLSPTTERALLSLALDLQRASTARRLYLAILLDFDRRSVTESLALELAYWRELLVQTDLPTPPAIPLTNISVIDVALANAYRSLREAMLGDVGAVAKWTELANAETVLSLLDHRPQDYFEQPLRAGLQRDLIPCFSLTYQRQPLPQPPPEATQFDACMRAFANWGTSQASQVEFLGDPDGPFTPDTVIREAQVNAWQRVAYWQGFAINELNGSCDAPVPVANAVEWAIAARAAARFASHWPGLASGASVSALAQLTTTGETIRAQLTGLSQCGEDSLIAASLNRYQQRLEALASSLDAALGGYRDSALRLGATLDLSTNADTKTSYRPQNAMVLPCDIDRACELNVELEPSNALFSLFPPRALTADQLQLDEVQLCYRDVGWVQRRSQPARDPAMANYYGKPTLTLVGRLLQREEELFAVTLTGDDEQEYLFAANTPEVLDARCPTAFIDQPISSSLPEGGIRLVPDRLTYLSAQRIGIGQLLASNWADGQEWRDRFLTEQVVWQQRPDDTALASWVDPAFAQARSQRNAAVYQSLTDRFARGDDLSGTAAALDSAKAGFAKIAQLTAASRLLLDDRLRQTLYGSNTLADREAFRAARARDVDPKAIVAAARNGVQQLRAQWLQTSTDTEVKLPPWLVRSELALNAALVQAQRERQP